MSADPLRACIEQYIRAHLRDPALTPATIAAAHSISLRHLYDVWGDEQATLARWIVLQRLAAVRDSLADPRLSHRSIAAIARGWCLSNPTHVARRFRQEYGLTPREWRRTAHRDGGGTARGR
jgi:AraC-like DNA-binding protein